jgi:hypothetical protein
MLTQGLDSTSRMVAAKTRNAREMVYKNHQIEVSVRSASKGSGWDADVYVTYSENGKNVLKSLRMDQTFATPDKAEQAGVEYAKKWIDDGKPDLSP